MDRRRYLRLAAGGLAGLAGCGARTDSPTATPTDHPATGGPTTGSPRARPGLAVGIRTARYVVLADAQTPADRAIEPEQITPVEAVDEPLRSALLEAIDGGYRTEDPSRALLRGIDRFRHHGGGYRFTPYVSRDRDPYRFEPTVPTFTARLETDVENPPAERTVGPDDLESFAEPVRDFVRTIGAFTVQVPRDTYRISVVPEAVRAFLAEYEYVRDPDGVGRIVTQRVDPGPPYTIAATGLTPEDLWGRPILEAAALPEDLRALVEAAVASNRRAPALPLDRTELRTDAIPASFDDYLGPDHGPGSGPYVALGGTPYAVRVVQPDRRVVPVTVSATAGGDRSFAVRIAGSSAEGKPPVQGTVRLSAAGAIPSVLWVLVDGERVLLDSDAYETVSWEPAEAGEVDRRIRNVDRAEIRTDGELAATYRVPEAVPPGTYLAWGTFEAGWTRSGDGRRFPSRPYPFQVVLDVA